MAKGNFKYDDIFDDNKKQEIIDDYVENELSLRDLCAKYDIRSRSWIEKLVKPYMRSFSESVKIAHRKKPNSFKHSEESKAKLRDARLKYMKEHPEKTAWRRSNISYPEKMFMKFLEEKGYSSKYLIHREYSVFPYFIDFAFVEPKIAIEIDGSQHLLPERKVRDEKKDALLIEQGWKVIRIAENIVKTDWESMHNTISQHLSLENIEPKTTVGIIKTPVSSYKKVPREANGKTKKQNEQIELQKSLSKKPSKEILEQLVLLNNNTAVGRMFGVSEMTVRKWYKSYGIVYKRSDRGLTLIPIKCPVCGKIFKPYERKRKYCSIECSSIAQTKEWQKLNKN